MRSAPVVIGALLVGSFVGALMNNVASASLAVIADDFSTSPAAVTVAASATGLALACCMPVAGWVGARWGARRSLTLAFALMAVGSAGAAAASSVELLTLARVLQGVGNCLVPPTVMAVLPAVAGSSRRARALGWWAVANGTGTAAGAPMGAALADVAGWRSVFVAFVPVCLVLAAVCRGALGDSTVRAPIDRGSAALVTLAFCCVLTPLVTIRLHHSTALCVLGAASGCVAAIWFGRRNGSRERPFVPPDLLRSAGYRLGAIGAGCQMFALGTVSVLVPVMVLDDGVSVGVGGLYVLAMSAAMVVSAPPVSAWISRHSPRRTVSVGFWGVALAQLLVAVLVARSHHGAALAGLVVLGCCLALLQTPSAVLVAEDPRSRGAGMGLYNAVRFGAGALGVSWLALLAPLPLSDPQALILAAALVAISGSAAVLGTRHDGSRQP